MFLKAFKGESAMYNRIYKYDLTGNEEVVYESLSYAKTYFTIKDISKGDLNNTYRLQVENDSTFRHIFRYFENGKDVTDKFRNLIYQQVFAQ